MNDQLVAPNLEQKGLKALDRQMLSYIAPPIMFPVHGFPGFCVPRMRYTKTLKEPMLEVKRKDVLPRELRRIRASALAGDKKYGSVMDVLQIVYGQDFGAILKDYVDTHQEELYKRGIMPDSLFTRLGGIGKPYIETNYDQPSKAFFLDVVVDCLLDGEHYQRCVSFYIRYKMSFCAMDPRCFLWEIGLYRSDVDDELRDTNRTKADGNLLPKITAAKYDEIVDDLLESYNPEALDAPGPVDVYKIADGMKLAVRELLIPDYNILGQLHFWPGTIEYLDKDGSKKVSRANLQAISYLTYRISPAAKSVDFERYSLSGSTYVKNDEGTKVLGKLAISLAEGRTVSDITVAKVVVTDDAGTSQTLTLSSSVLTAALSASGYVETSPSLFSSITFNTGRNYTLTFTIGDAYDKAVFSVLVARAFANLHLSGLATGGVAIGKFSAATQGNPLFECAFPIVLSGSKTYGPESSMPANPVEGQLYFVVE